MDLTVLISTLHLELEQIDTEIRSLKNSVGSPNARPDPGYGYPVLVGTRALKRKAQKAKAMTAGASGNSSDGEKPFI
jgi:hypothetical protein